MAEYILKDKVKKLGIADKFDISSAGTSSEEVGNPIYPPAKAVLEKHGITDLKNHKAKQIKLSDYSNADIIFAMDFHNMRNLMRISGNDPQNKLKMFIPDEIEDPWYTNNFEKVYNMINNGCEKFLNDYLLKNKIN